MITPLVMSYEYKNGTVLRMTLHNDTTLATAIRIAKDNIASPYGGYTIKTVGILRGGLLAVVEGSTVDLTNEGLRLQSEEASK